MGKSVNPFSMPWVDYKWMMKTFKFCEKCGKPCILDTVDNYESVYNTKTGVQEPVSFWGCPDGSYIPMIINAHTAFLLKGVPDAKR